MAAKGRRTTIHLGAAHSEVVSTDPSNPKAILKDIRRDLRRASQYDTTTMAATVCALHGIGDRQAVSKLLDTRVTAKVKKGKGRHHHGKPKRP